MSHLEFAAAESASLDSDRDWLNWINHAEKLIGHSLDGDEKADGYSLDYALDAWRKGHAAAAYVAMVATRSNYRRP